jgi:hypothetical protein
VRSLALTSRFMTTHQLQVLAEDIRAQRRLDIPVDVLEQAKAALPEGETTLTALRPREIPLKGGLESNPTIPYSIPAGGNPGPADWARRIIELAGICEGFTGWHESGTPHELEAELSARRRHYRDILVSALDQLPSVTLLEAITLAVKSATHEGRTRAPGLLEDLIASYELRARTALDKGYNAIRRIINAVQTADGDDAAETSQLALKRLDKVAREWKVIVKPIELVARSRGEIYSPLRHLGDELRALATGLAGRSAASDMQRQIAILLREIFDEPEDTLEDPHSAPLEGSSDAAVV